MISGSALNTSRISQRPRSCGRGCLH